MRFQYILTRILLLYFQVIDKGKPRKLDNLTNQNPQKIYRNARDE